MINSLKDVKEINGKKVMTNDERPKNIHGDVDWESFDKMREEIPICIDHKQDMISFKILTKPASEGGNLNLCQWSDLVATGLQQLKYLNAKFSCRENSIMITKLEEVLMWNDKRTQDRIARGVEGKDEK